MAFYFEVNVGDLWGVAGDFNEPADCGGIGLLISLNPDLMLEYPIKASALVWNFCGLTEWLPIVLIDQLLCLLVGRNFAGH